MKTENAFYILGKRIGALSSNAKPTDSDSDELDFLKTVANYMLNTQAQIDAAKEPKAEVKPAVAPPNVVNAGPVIAPVEKDAK